MAVRFVNNFSAALAAGIDSVETVLTFAAGVGDAFRLLLGSPLSTDHIYLTLYNSGGDIEYVKCTSTSGDEFTVVRGQDNSTARAWLADDMVACRPNAASLQEATSIPTDLAHSGINIDITEMRGLTTPLSATQGGTGVVSLAALKTAMGLDIGVNVSAYVAPGASGNIMVSNGTAWVSQAPVSGSLLGMYAKTTAGTETASRPTGATKALIKVQGAGGGCDHLSTAGGGAYAEAVKTVTGSLTVTVGAAGTYVLGVPTAGGNSSVSGSGFTTVTAAGGGTTTGGSLPTTGDFNLAGGDDGDAYLGAGHPFSGKGGLGDGVIGAGGYAGAVYIYWFA